MFKFIKNKISNKTENKKQGINEDKIETVIMMPKPPKGKICGKCKGDIAQNK